MLIENIQNILLFGVLTPRDAKKHPAKFQIQINRSFIHSIYQSINQSINQSIMPSKFGSPWNLVNYTHSRIYHVYMYIMYIYYICICIDMYICTHIKYCCLKVYSIYLNIMHCWSRASKVHVPHVGWGENLTSHEVQVERKERKKRKMTEIMSLKKGLTTQNQDLV